jgi:hypothetical protein
LSIFGTQFSRGYWSLNWEKNIYCFLKAGFLPIFTKISNTIGTFLLFSSYKASITVKKKKKKNVFESDWKIAGLKTTVVFTYIYQKYTGLFQRPKKR